MSEQTNRGGAMVVHSDESTALAAPGDFGPEHMQIVKDAYCEGASDLEFMVLWQGAKSRGLDPIKKQIHFVKRWDDMAQRDKWSSQVSIDGFRSIADGTGKYDGQDEPVYERDPEDGFLIARVRVYRKDIGRAFVGVARFPEFAQTKRNGDETYMWKRMPFHMLGKCAEALALRKAFPEKLSGIYIPEEMSGDSDAILTEGVAVEPTPRAPEADDTRPPPLPPKLPSASDLMRRLDGAGRDAAREIVRAAATMPKVRAHAWRRLIEMAGNIDEVNAVVREIEADGLPSEIVDKLHATATEAGNRFALMASAETGAAS